eukprot:3123359-Rhodomonas_salina.2
MRDHSLLPGTSIRYVSYELCATRMGRQQHTLCPDMTRRRRRETAEDTMAVPDMAYLYIHLDPEQVGAA